MHHTALADTRLPPAHSRTSHITAPLMPTPSCNDFVDRVTGDRSGVFVVSEGEFWRIEMFIADELRLLTDGASSTGRVFSSLGDASDFLHALGVLTFSVIPGPTPRSAIDYDNWVLETIQDALLEADDPATEWVSNEDVETAAKDLIRGGDA
ncbi:MULTISPECIES: hypothetical protein [Pandoraea]|uniref:hypothetical protein n=1 Tax=Pandoraea TaxID=93217 RepID=UPI001F5D6DB0|nr:MULTISPECIES: hypothetical protein [Pandoraea]